MLSRRLKGDDGQALMQAMSEKDDILAALASSDILFIPVDQTNDKYQIGGIVRYDSTSDTERGGKLRPVIAASSSPIHVSSSSMSNNVKLSPDDTRMGVEGGYLFGYPFDMTLERPLSSTITDKVIVLDLDETLVHSYANSETLELYDKLGLGKISDLSHRTYLMQIRDALNSSDHPRGEGVITKIWGVIRPHTKEFLLFCFSYFKAVIVWSAGTKKYVHDIVKIIFSDMPQPHAVLTRNDCTKIDDYHDKNLNKLFNHGELGRYAGPENTLIIDDREVSFSSCPNNGVIIPGYNPHPSISSIKSDDIALLQLRAWFLRSDIKTAKDVRGLKKSIDEIFSHKISSFGSTPYIQETVYPSISTSHSSAPIDLSDVYNNSSSRAQSSLKMIQVR